MDSQQNIKLYILSFPSNAATVHAFAELCHTFQQQDTLEKKETLLNRGKNLNWHEVQQRNLWKICIRVMFIPVQKTSVQWLRISSGMANGAQCVICTCPPFKSLKDWKISWLQTILHLFGGLSSQYHIEKQQLLNILDLTKTVFNIWWRI